MIQKLVPDKCEERTLMSPLLDDPETMWKGFLITYWPGANEEVQNSVEELFGFGSSERTVVFMILMTTHSKRPKRYMSLGLSGHTSSVLF